jgi:MFS family permease
MYPGRQIHPALIAVLFEGFLSRLSFGIISFALPLFAYRKLGLSLSEAGLLFSLNLIAEQAFKPMMGWAADRWGLRPAFTASIGLRSVVALLLVFAVAPWQVFAIRFLHGFSESMRDPAVNALIAEYSAHGRLASAFSWYSTAKMVAGSMGKALGGFLLAWSSETYSTTFLIAFSLSLLPLFVVLRYVREPRQRLGTASVTSRADSPSESDDVSSAPMPVLMRTIVPIAMLGFLLSSTAHLIQSLFPIIATEYGGLTVAQTALIYVLSVVFLLVSGPFFGWLSDNVTRHGVLMVRGIANSLSSLLYWFAPGMTGFTVGTIADSLGKAAFRPAWGSLMATIASLDRRRRARTMSYLSLGEGLGETLGPLMGGLLWHFWGLPVLLATRLALAIGAEIYAISLTGRIETLSNQIKTARTARTARAD